MWLPWGLAGMADAMRLVPGLAQDSSPPQPWELILLFSLGTYKAGCSGKDLDYRFLEDSQKVKGPCSKGLQKERSLGGEGVPPWDGEGAHRPQKCRMG